MSEPKRRTCGECWWWVRDTDGLPPDVVSSEGLCHVEPDEVTKDEGDFCSRHWPDDGSWGDPLRKDPVKLALVVEASAVIDAAKAYRDDPGTVTEGKLLDCLRALDERTEG